MSEAQRNGPGNCLPKTQGCAKSKDAVYSLTPARCRKVKRRAHRKGSGHCLNRDSSEIVVSVKMPITRDGTKRPREPLLQLNIATGHALCRIGRRQRTRGASPSGAAVEIRPWACLVANLRIVRTLFGG